MNGSSGSILVVENIPNVLELLEETLHSKGYAVITARNIHEALEQVASQHPAMVITDILMPKMDGFVMAYQLRNDPDTRQIPLIFLSTTFITPEDRDFALSLGAVRFIEQPIDTQDLLLAVAEILAQESGPAPEPLGDHDFNIGYRERLEQMLRHKNARIAQTEHLLTRLPENQRPVFDALHKQSLQDRNEIQSELDQINKTLEEYKRK